MRRMMCRLLRIPYSIRWSRQTNWSGVLLHHQAVKSVDNTRLAVTGTAETNGISIIEAVERTDKTFAVGLQFHPEAAVAKYLDDADNKNDFTDYDTALSIFRYIVREFADPVGLQDAA